MFALKSLLIPAGLMLHSSFSKPLKFHAQEKSQSQQRLGSSNVEVKEYYQKQRALNIKDNNHPFKINDQKYQEEQESTTEMNLFDHIKKSLAETSIKEGFLYLLLGVSSVYFAKYARELAFFKLTIPMHAKSQQRYSKLHEFLIKNIQNVDLNNKNIPDGQLIYGSGSVSTHLQNNKLLADPQIGVKSNSSTILGLSRQVEVYKNYYYQSNWINAYDFAKVQQSGYRPCMQSIYFTPSQVKLGEYELSYQMYSQLFNVNQALKVKLDPQQIDEHYQQLMKAEKTQEYKPIPATEGYEFIYLTQQNAERECTPPKNYHNHPFSYAISQNKKIVYQDDYIYIVDDINNLKEGDIRISYYDIYPYYKASIIAQKQGNHLVFSQIDHFTNKQVLNEYLEIANSNLFPSNLGIADFQIGIVDRKLMIENILNQLAREDCTKEYYQDYYLESRTRFNLKCLIVLIYCFLYPNIILTTYDLSSNIFLGMTAFHASMNVFYGLGSFHSKNLLYGIIFCSFACAKGISYYNQIKKNKQNQNEEQQYKEFQKKQWDQYLQQKKESPLSKQEEQFIKMIQGNKK